MIEKPKSSRAIIIKDKKILLMHRIKFGRNYYTLIGGGIKKNETPDKALLRETKEETCLDVIEYKKVFELEDELRYAYYYLVTKFEGEPELEGPEKKRNSEENQYILEWIPFELLEDIDIINNPELKKKLKETLMYNCTKSK